MLVKFTQDVIWYEVTWTEGQEVELDDVLYQRFKRAGYIKEVKKRDTNLDTYKDGTDSEPVNDSGSENTPPRRTNRRRQ